MYIIDHIFQPGFESKALAMKRKNETIDAMLFELDEFMKNPNKTNKESFTMANLNTFVHLINDV